MAKKTDWKTIGILALLFIGLWMFMGGKFPKMQIGQVNQGGVNVPGQNPPSIVCPDNLLTSVKVAARNPLNASLEYNSGTFRIVDAASGKTVTTVTSGASGLGTGVNVQCGKDYILYYLGDGTLTSVKYPFTASGAELPIYVDVPEASDVEFKILDSSYNDVNGTSGWYQDVAVPATAIAFGAGTTNTYYLKIRVTNSAAQFGSDGLQNYLCVDFDTSKFSKTNGVIVSGLSEVPVPAALQAQGMDKCWALPVIKSTDGEITYTVTLRADLGDPTSGVKFQVFDGNYYEKLDGTIGAGVANDAYTLIGSTDRFVTLNIQ